MCCLNTRPQALQIDRAAKRQRAGPLGALLTVLLTAAIVPAHAASPDTLVSDLEQRAAQGGIDKVNADLSDPGSVALVFLNHSTSICELQAVSLSIRLARGSKSAAVDAHRASLRTAVGRCTRFVLALLSPTEVPVVCASLESWAVGQMARELRRRIKAIESDEMLRSTQRGKACRAAYVYELNNTRVGLRVQPPRAAPHSK